MKKRQIANLVLSLIFTSFLFLWISLLAQNSESKNVEVAKNYENYQKEVSGKAYVSDGDTIKINNERIRLLYIDTPEKKQLCFDKNDKKYQCGMMAKYFLIKFINKRIVTCKYNKRDIYNRILGHCYVNNISLNKTMIEKGMAVVFSYQKVSSELKELQAKAKNNKLGIWQGKFELPKDYRKRTK